MVELVERFDAFMVDAYGVLVDGTSALPGADTFVAALEASGKPWTIVTNDASRTPSTSAARYRSLGLPIPDGHVLTSGSLLPEQIRALGLGDQAVLVLGPEDCHRHVEAGGAVPIGPTHPGALEAEALVVGDQGGYDLGEGLEVALSLLYRCWSRGRCIPLLLPNPDLVYPKRPGEMGFAAGSLAAMLEGALELRYPGRPENRFRRLGKPYPPIYEAAMQRLGTRRAVMVGDQLATDVAGALGIGLPAVLVTSGVITEIPPESPQPSYIMAGLLG